MQEIGSLASESSPVKRLFTGPHRYTVTDGTIYDVELIVLARGFYASSAFKCAVIGLQARPQAEHLFEIMEQMAHQGTDMDACMSLIIACMHE